MRLKRIIAAMLLIGVSSSAWAALASNANSDVQHDAMNARVSRVDGLLNQNQGGAGLGAALMQNWFNSVTISGVLNVDAIASNRSVTDDFFYGPHRLNVFYLPYRAVNMYNNDDTGNTFRLADANVLLDMTFNCWASAHLGVNFRALSNADADTEILDHSLIISDFDLPIVDEVYITLMNENSPFYGRFGRQYLTFGDYNIYETVPTLTQLLSETNQMAIVAGYNDPSTFGVNIYAFNGLDHDGAHFRDSDRTVVRNFGVSLSFGDVDTLGYKVGVGYLDNMADVAYIANQTQNWFDYEGYTDRVHALSANAAFKSGFFDANVKYVAALDDFNVNDIAHDLSNTQGASPWALSAGVGYAFNAMQWPARFGVSYQQSGDAASIGTQGMPERRYQAEFNIGVARNANVGITLFNDRDYDINEGGSGKNSFTGVLRLSVNVV